MKIYRNELELMQKGHHLISIYSYDRLNDREYIEEVEKVAEVMYKSLSESERLHLTEFENVWDALEAIAYDDPKGVHFYSARLKEYPPDTVELLD